MCVSVQINRNINYKVICICMGIPLPLTFPKYFKPDTKSNIDTTSTSNSPIFILVEITDIENGLERNRWGHVELQKCYH